MRASSSASRWSALIASTCTLLVGSCRDTTSPSPATLNFSLSPASSVALSPILPVPTVVILDTEGDTARTAENEITIALGSNQAGGTLSGTTTVKAINGVARFNNLTIDKAGTGYSLVASSPNLGTVTSATFAVLSGAPSKLEFQVQPVTTLARTTLPPFSIILRDAAGNTVTSVPVTIQLTGPPGMTGTLSQNTVNGIATFSNVMINTPGTALIITARIAATSPVPPTTSAPFNVITGPAAKLAFNIQPIVTAPGATIPPIQALVVDQAGNSVTTGSYDVTVSILANPGGATLGGTATRTSAGGEVTFSDLFINNAGAGYTLVLSAPGLSSVTSQNFSIRNPIAFQSVTAGYFHSCGISVGGAAYCWGENFDGQLGDALPVDRRASAEPISSSLNFASAVAGRTHNCGKSAAGTGYCWGSNAAGALGGQAVRGEVATVSGNLSFGSIVAGYGHSCGVTTSGAAYCWGDNSAGELGIGATTAVVAPVPVAGGISFTTVSAGRYFTCGRSALGAAFCWGENVSGMLGDGTTTRRLIPTQVVSQQNFSYVGAGGFSACALTASGDAYCWGQNDFGQLGDGTTSNRLTPVLVAGGRTFTQLSVGNRHACAIDQDGTAYCWGDNSSGSLGNGGTTTKSLVPVAVPGNLRFANISAGRFHTCGVTTEGVAYCWGENGNGQLGDGTTVGRLSPVRVR